MSGPIDRVVVTLDATAENRSAIDTAARLAARAKAALHGLFVEDEDLLSLASLPFVRQVTLGGGAEPFTAENIELQLRAEAERARQELFAAAKQHRVECTFEIVRGASQIAVAVASERDLVVAGAMTRPVAGHFRVERRWWSSIEAAAGPFLLTRNAWGPPGSIVMLLRDRGPGSARLLDAATQIAEAEDAAMTVICPSEIAGSAGFEKWLADRLAGHAVRVQVEVAPTGTAALQARIGELDCRLLAIEGGVGEGSPDRLREFAGQCSCDILVVR